MRDLYRRLGIPANATRRAIARSTARCDNRALQTDARRVLDDPARRRQYDDLHRLLGELGRLRANLGMTHTPHWQGDVANDFSVPAERAPARLKRLDAKLAALLRRHQRRRQRTLARALAIALALAAAYAAGRLLG
ncbi:hypothetical protein [Salinisphaera sp. LB1]|uniref:hypothetical protein n=1 Tax=Salinisphaera sp. LB1 TaxID=2183911 RepID=UPI000D7055B5|nr:hypothetical protein [Salinisphaera sp. LB1]AWN16845.1 hypothetical protein SALB1_2649 [Salinisphaera sp. LB1]